METYDMIAHSNEQVEEQSSTFFHLHLHGATPLESISAADDESQVVGSQLRVCVGCLRVGVAGGGEDGADLDARLEALFAKRKAAELREIVAKGCTAGERSQHDAYRDEAIS